MALANWGQLVTPFCRTRWGKRHDVVLARRQLDDPWLMGDGIVLRSGAGWYFTPASGYLGMVCYPNERHLGNGVSALVFFFFSYLNQLSTERKGGRSGGRAASRDAVPTLGLVRDFDRVQLVGCSGGLSLAE